MLRTEILMERWPDATPDFCTVSQQIELVYYGTSTAEPGCALKRAETQVSPIAVLLAITSRGAEDQSIRRAWS